MRLAWPLLLLAGCSFNVKPVGLDGAAAFDLAGPVDDLSVEDLAPALAIAFSSAPQSVVAGVCSMLTTVESRDPQGNPAAPAAALAIALTPSQNTLTLYSDAACATPLTSVTIAAGSTSASFYFRGTTPAAVTITAASSLGSATQTEVISPVIAFTSAPQVVTTGSCSSAFDLVSHDSSGNLAPAASPTPIALSASPPTGLGFYSDAACTMMVSSANLATGSSTAGFYVKTNDAGSVTLTAGNATQTLKVMLPVQTGNCTIANTALDSSTSCALPSPIPDVNKAMLLFQATSSDSTPLGAEVRCQLVSPSSISCDRNGTTGAVNIHWQVMPFASGVTVEHLAPGCVAGVIDVPITAVANPASTFLLLSTKRNGQEIGEDDLRTVQLTSSSNVQIVQSTAACDGDAHALQVVQFSGANVSRGMTGPLPSPSPSATVSGLAAVDLSRTFLLYSWRSAATGAEMCERMVRGTLSDATSIVFSRGDGAGAACTGQDIDAISWERVELPAGSSVQQVVAAMAAGTAGANLPISKVDVTRSLTFSGGQWSDGQALGEGSYSGDDLIGAMVARLRLGSATQLQLVRDDTSGSARFTAYVVQFAPP